MRKLGEQVSSCTAAEAVRPATTATTAKDPVHVHDLQATLLHLLGFDHEKLTYRHMGRDFRLTDVHGQVVNKLLA